MSEKWHANREEVFAVMRQIDDVVQHAWSRSRQLTPRYVEIAIGSADYDYTLQATVGEEFLRAMRCGCDPTAAYEAAVAAGEESIAKWNSRGCLSRMTAVGRFELHRDKCAASSIALGFLSRFSHLNKSLEKSQQPKAAPDSQSRSRVRFERPIVDGTTYCGPTCLSALSGLGTQEIARILRRQFGMKSVRGLPLNQMRWFIEKVGYQLVTLPRPHSLLSNYRRQDAVCLIELDDHWLLKRDRRIVCTQFGSSIGNIDDSVYRDHEIVAIHEIQGEPNETAVKALAASRTAAMPKNQMLLNY